MTTRRARPLEVILSDVLERNAGCRRGMVREMRKALGRWRSSSMDDHLGSCLTEDLGLHGLQAAWWSSSMSFGDVAMDAPVAELVRDINESKKLVAKSVVKRDKEA